MGDTHQGGSILWIVGELTTLVAMGIIVYQWMLNEERQAARNDRQLDAVDAAEAAAQAAVAAERDGAGARRDPGAPRGTVALDVTDAASP